jgi:integrase
VLPPRHGVAQGSYVEPSKTTIAAFLDQWLTHIEPGVAPRTHERYRESAQEPRSAARPNRKARDPPASDFTTCDIPHATHLLSIGVHPKVAQERLGHSSIGITLDLYSHVLPGMQDDAAAKVDAAIRAAIDKS